MCLDEFVGDGGRLFHHITEVARQREMSHAAAEAHFDGKQLASDGCPSQTGSHARHRVFYLVFVVVHRHSQYLTQFAHRYPLLHRLFHHHILGTGTHHIGNLAFQVTDTSLTGVVVDDLHHDIFGEGDLLAIHAVFLELFRNQVTLGNFKLLFTEITA